MKVVGSLLLVMSVMALMYGCGENKPAQQDCVKLAKLNSLEIESVSIIEEKIGRDKILLKIPCSACLGVDLDKVAYDRTDESLTITLPPVELQSPKVHHKEEIILDEQRSIWTSPNAMAELRESAERRAQQEVQDLALTSEFIADTKKRTETLIRCFYRQVDSTNIQVTIVWEDKK